MATLLSPTELAELIRLMEMEIGSRTGVPGFNATTHKDSLVELAELETLMMGGIAFVGYGETLEHDLATLVEAEMRDLFGQELDRFSPMGETARLEAIVGGGLVMDLGAVRGPTILGPVVVDIGESPRRHTLHPAGDWRSGHGRHGHLAAAQMRNRLPKGGRRRTRFA